MTCCGDQNPGIGINGIWIGSDFATTGKVALGGGGLVQIHPPTRLQGYVLWGLMLYFFFSDPEPLPVKENNLHMRESDFKRTFKCHWLQTILS